MNADLEDTRVWVNDILHLWWRARAADLLQTGMATLEKKLNANLPAFLVCCRRPLSWLTSIYLDGRAYRISAGWKEAAARRQGLKTRGQFATKPDGSFFVGGYILIASSQELDVSASYGGEMEAIIVAVLSENLKIQLRVTNIFIKTKVRCFVDEPLPFRDVCM